MVSAKRHPRAPERGAAIFVVVMVLTMLTAIGVFAIRAASLASSASGYERQSAQNQSVAELGIVAAVSELGTERRNAYVQKVLAGADSCLTARWTDAGAGTSAPCYKVYASDLVRQGISPFSAADAGVGSFGPASVEGDFLVEMTDPGPAGMAVAGTDVGGNHTFRYLQLTLTSTGQVRPIPASATDTAAASLAGNASSRAYVVVGPVP